MAWREGYKTVVGWDVGWILARMKHQFPTQLQATVLCRQKSLGAGVSRSSGAVMTYPWGGKQMCPYLEETIGCRVFSRYAVVLVEGICFGLGCPVEFVPELPCRALIVISDFAPEQLDFEQPTQPCKTEQQCLSLEISNPRSENSPWLPFHGPNEESCGPFSMKPPAVAEAFVSLRQLPQMPEASRDTDNAQGSKTVYAHIYGSGAVYSLGFCIVNLIHSYSLLHDWAFGLDSVDSKTRPRLCFFHAPPVTSLLW